ncbi:MAG: glycosyltransferase family 4 protein [Planctomycetes bacterium]|nr:glycosyltransferase family 4 protein [Planctomycetota bacterium]
MKKILFVYYEPLLSGITKHVHSIMTRIDREKFTPYVLVSSNDRKIAETFLPLFGGNAESADAFRQVPAGKFFSIAGMVEIIRLHNKEHFDVIHLHNLHTGLWGHIAGALCKETKVFFTPHVYQIRNGFMRFVYHKWVWKFYGRLTDRLIALTESQKTWFLNAGIADESIISVIPNGIEKPIVQKIDRENLTMNVKFANEDILICMAGRLTEQKNPLFLLEIANELKKQSNRYKFIVAGDGPLYGAMSERIKALGLENAICLLGWREDPDSVLAACDICISTSRWEGMPYSILEAFALEKPVVATDVDGNRDLVEHNKDGLLVQEGNIVNFVRAIKELAENTALKSTLTENAVRKFHTRYAIENMLKQTEMLYSSL